MKVPGRLRILMTTDAVGGVWVYASTLARALCGDGNEVMLVTMGPAPRREQLRPLLGIRGLHVRITDLRLEWLDPLGKDLSRARDTLLSIAEIFRPDIIHLNGFREGVFNWPSSVLIAAHSCVHTWWRACRGDLPSEPQWRRYAENAANGLSAADAWVAPTAAFRDAISGAYRPDTQGRTIHNGLSMTGTIDHKRPIVLAAGRLWDEAKNIVALSSKAGSLPWPVHIAGQCQAPDGPAISLPPGVTMLGDLPRWALLAAMRRASVFVAPALYEPFGLTVLEAAACGCALILSDLPTFRELWADAALYVAPHDQEALCAAVTLVCRHDSLRTRLQRAATARARLYSTAAMSNAYQELYAEIAGISPQTKMRNASAAELPA